MTASCPTCSGPTRETVNMVCQTCGTDYALRFELGRRIGDAWDRTGRDGFRTVDWREEAVSAVEHVVLAAQLEALNLRTERDVAQAEAAALRDLMSDLLTGVRSTYHYLGDLQLAVQHIVGGDV